MPGVDCWSWSVTLTYETDTQDHGQWARTYCNILISKTDSNNLWTTNNSVKKMKIKLRQQPPSQSSRPLCDDTICFKTGIEWFFEPRTSADWFKLQLRRPCALAWILVRNSEERGKSRRLTCAVENNVYSTLRYARRNSVACQRVLEMILGCTCLTEQGVTCHVVISEHEVSERVALYEQRMEHVNSALAGMRNAKVRKSCAIICKLSDPARPAQPPLQLHVQCGDGCGK